MSKNKSNTFNPEDFVKPILRSMFHPSSKVSSDGVTVIPHNPENPKAYGYEHWEVVGGELPNGKIKILRDITKKFRKGRIISREKFDVTYFEDAL